MANNVDLATLRTKVLQRADMERSKRVGTAEVNSYINEGLSALHDLLVASYGEDYLETSATIAIVSGTPTYALPATFYKMLALDIPGGTGVLSIKKFDWNQRNIQLPTDVYNVRYKLQGSSILLKPTPAFTVTATLWFVPKFPVLAIDTDTYDDINGWSEYAIYDAAIKCVVKDEGDASHLMEQRQIQHDRIVSMAPNRDQTAPPKVVDVTRSYDGREGMQGVVGGWGWQ